MKGTSSRLRKLGLGLLLLISIPASAQAGDLKSLVTDLWGGDGITLFQSSGVDHSAHFTGSSLSDLEDLGGALSASLGLLALNSTVSGFSFDLERGVPVRTSESLGPLIAERATTLGKGKLNLAFSYSRFDFEQFEGKDLDSLSFILNHPDVNNDGRLGPPPAFAVVELDQVRVDLDLELEQDVYAFYATYGWSWKLDVGLVVPIVHLRMRVDGVATILDNGGGGVHSFAPSLADQPTSSARGSETGIGDILLRTKYNLVEDRADWPDIAVRGQVTLPTGDEDDLLGTGESQFELTLVASKTYGSATPHLNLGYELVPGESKLNNFSYVIGSDYRLHPRLTTSLSVIGLWEPTGDDIGDHLIDLALGAKWELPGSVVLGTYVLLPLNVNEGLRTDFAWTIGIESTF